MLEKNSLRALERQRNFCFKVLKKKKFNLEKIGVKHEFKISTLGDWENGGSFDQSHYVGNAKTTLIEMNKIGS